jgi:hypothetical protein
MSTWILSFFATVLILLTAPSSQCAGNLNNSGNYFWDNLSWDGPQANIGFCMTGTGTCTLSDAGAPGAVPYWALSGGGADPNFTVSATQPITFTFEAALAGNARHDTFGWILPGDTSSGGSMFTGAATPGTSVTLPAGDYGLYLDNATPSINDTWYSQAFLNGPGETSDQHFVIFNAGSSFWIGMEALPFEHSDKDYQDMVVQVTTGASDPLQIQGFSSEASFQSWSTPEPGTFGLLFVGLLGLVGVVFKRRSLFASPF